MKTVMIVDDEMNILKALRRSLIKKGWSVTCVASPIEALNKAQQGMYAVIISDYKMPLMNGIDFLLAVQKLQPYSSKIMLSGQADYEALTNAINYSAVDRFIDKPWTDISLCDALDWGHKAFLSKLRNDRHVNKASMSKEQSMDWNEQLLEQASPGITKVHRNEMGWIECDLE